jgi:hypothetical protein
MRSRLHSSTFLLFFILPLLSYLGTLFILNPHITHAAGNTYYVSKQGSDSNSCDTARNPGSSAKLTIADGAACMSGGDTLLIQAGTYVEQMIGDFGFPFRNGTTGQYTRYAAYQSDVVIVRPTSGDTVMATTDNTYIEFDRIIWDGGGLNSCGAGVIRFLGDNHHHMRMRGGQIRNNPCAQGIGGIGPNGEVLGVEIHHNGGYGIYDVSSDTVIDGNIFHDNGGFAVHAYDGTTTDPAAHQRMIIRNNIMYGNGCRTGGPDGQGHSYPTIIMGMMTDGQIYNNIIYGNWSGITVDPDTNGVKVYNNTIYNNNLRSGCAFQDPPTCVDVGIYSDRNADIRNNICYQTGSINNGGSGTIQSNNLIDSNPNFVNPSSGDFHLQSSSPARDAGVSLPEVPCDHDGNARPSGSAYDIGAYEYGSSPGSGCSGSSASPTPTPSTMPCTRYTNQSQIPTGFGVPWDVTNPSIMLVSANCTPPMLLLKAGNPNTTKTLYVYKDGYVAPSGGSSWTPVQLFGSNLISGAWYPSSAQGVTQIPDPTKTTYYVAYTCTWTGSKWMCGCRDAQCGQSYWQLQRIQ